MVIKKSFTLLVASGITPFFAFVSIISVKGCRNDAGYFMRSIDATRCHENFINTDLEAILTVSKIYLVSLFTRTCLFNFHKIL